MFALFAGHNYYPSGGWDDHIATFATLEEARAAVADARSHIYANQTYDWFQIVDLVKGEVVEQY